MKDRFGRRLRDIRVSVTDRCNFRCPYCMPAEIYGERYEFLPRPEILTFEEIERLARLFGSLGASKLRITGGEPLVRAKLPNLIERLAAIETVEDLTLTTNGFLLAKMAQSLKDAGLQRVTVSLDSLDPDTFSKMAGRNYGPERVLEGIEAAERAGLSPIKINCVGTGHIVRFIEFMDVGNRNGWNLNQVVTASEIIGRINAEFPLEPIPSNYPGEVANRYRYSDGSGEIGVIASVSVPFCGDCTRGRLSTDGRFVTCLFASGGKDLKTPMRSGATDEELLQIISGVWERRSDRYSEERAANTDFEGNVTLPVKR
ncbi:GTP 3',8-cyclase [Geodia barretti]|uniref:GTP 3',8-cyclase n=1 Tax=Geodia barretti TaxID=519541 RepID=A0AA35TTK7_GEOBA|nr:GTP 3',8-cyclase [Geodia barretti]